MFNSFLYVYQRVRFFSPGPVVAWNIFQIRISAYRHLPPENHWYPLVNGNFRILNWRYLPYIRQKKAYVREYPHKIWSYMVQYPHFRILKFHRFGNQTWQWIIWVIFPMKITDILGLRWLSEELSPDRPGIDWDEHSIDLDVAGMALRAVDSWTCHMK